MVIGVAIPGARLGGEHTLRILIIRALNAPRHGGLWASGTTRSAFLLPAATNNRASGGGGTAFPWGSLVDK